MCRRPAIKKNWNGLPWHTRFLCPQSCKKYTRSSVDSCGALELKTLCKKQIQGKMWLTVYVVCGQSWRTTWVHEKWHYRSLTATCCKSVLLTLAILSTTNSAKCCTLRSEQMRCLYVTFASHHGKNHFRNFRRVPKSTSRIALCNLVIVSCGI